MSTQADILPDQNEHPSSMEPLVISSDSRYREELNDLALTLAMQSTQFVQTVPASLVQPLAGLVRSMNCYYSNLIEGHDTHPVDIERALREDYSHDSHRRDLQLEARAHIAVQAWIDGGGLPGSECITAAGIREIHRQFYEHVPDTLRLVTDPDSGDVGEVRPGALRERYVRVGQHIPVSPGALPRFLERFETLFGSLGKTELLVSAAAAHHRRLLWLHPFLDGNGRVARLMSHAVMLTALQTGGLWSVARGLARNAGEYKTLLAKCDMTRRNDLDGRGTLSEEALATFTRFFLSVCIDQVAFLRSLIQPDRLRARILSWAEQEVRVDALPARAVDLLSAVLYQGELARGEAERVTGTGERQARRIVASLTDRGVLVSDGPRQPLRLGLPAALAHWWMPGLFPESGAERVS